MAKFSSATLRKPFDALGNEWNRMSPRERQLVSLLGASVVLFVIVIAGFLFFSSLSETSDENEEIRDALKAIARNRTEYLEAKAKQRAQEVRIGSLPPQLLTDLEGAAREVGIQMAETSERPATEVGRHYMEHTVDVKLRSIDLRELSRFLQKLETGERLIYVTKLEVRRRFAEKDKLDISLTATALERLAKERPAKAGKGRRS